MAAMLVLALLAQEWQYRPGTGFYNTDTLERKTPEALLETARAHRKARRSAPAAGAYQALRDRAPAVSIRRAAHFELADTYAEAGDAYSAYHAYESYILRYPQSVEATEAKRKEMAAALQLAKTGHTEGFLGIPLLTTSKTGIEYLRDALRRYPREEFSSKYAQRLGMFFYERAEFDLAEAEFSMVMQQYAASADSVLALYMLGRSTEQRFDAIDYDDKPLKDSRRHYERFVEEAERMRKLPGGAKQWVDRLLPAVKERLAIVYIRMQEKQLQTAEYYDWKGYPKAARIYFRNLLADESSFKRVLGRDFRTAAAGRAREWLGEPLPAEAPRPASEPKK